MSGFPEEGGDLQKLGGARLPPSKSPNLSASLVIRNTPSTVGNFMTSSERPSPEPILKKEASPAVLGGREFWKHSGSLKCLELSGLGRPSRTLEGNSRKRSESVSGVFPEFFRNFFRKVPAVLGVWPEVGNRPNLKNPNLLK